MNNINCGEKQSVKHKEVFDIVVQPEGKKRLPYNIEILAGMWT